MKSEENKKKNQGDLIDSLGFKANLPEETLVKLFADN